VPAKKKDTQSFEKSLAELESLVGTLEQGDLSLEESLKSFERGVELTRNCQEALKLAEQKIRILTDNSVTGEAESFSSGN